MEQPSLLQTNNKFVYFNTARRVNEHLVQIYEIGIVQSYSEGEYIVLIVRIGEQVRLSRNAFEFFDPTAVGDGFPKKVCNVCQRYLDTTMFEFNQNGRDNRRVRRPSCRDCRVVINGVSASRAERIRWERIRPSLIPFTCPICGKTTIPDLTSKVVLDHDHKTGRIRGWICDSCNTGIGRFKDDIELLKVAIKYLETN